jgi:two-component system sensor histidine kinase HydH
VDLETTHGRKLEDVLPPGHPVRELAARAFENGANGSLSVRIPLGPNGADPPSAAITHPIPGLGNRGGGILIEFREEAALRELHSLVDHSRVLSRLGQMAVGVAHEIRNPLQALSFELGAMRESRDLAHDEIEPRVQVMMEEVQRLQRAVSGFLKVARLRQLTYASASLNELCEEIHRSMEVEADLAGVELDLDLDADLPETLCDREVLRQAIQNLVTNATQALPSSTGHVTLSSRHVDSVIRISVADTGPGIRQEHLEKVCDLYFTTKPGGSGVGLSLVRQAVEMHGGELEIDSHPGAGTTMTLRIPIHTPEEGEG